MEQQKTLIPNSTQIPNCLLDLLIPLIPEAEGKCLLYICRRTYGFHKDEDRISFSQFLYGIKDRGGKTLDNGCGLKARASVCEGLRNLSKSNAIFIRKDSKGNYYQINLDMDISKVVQQIDQFRKQTKIGLLNRPKQVHLLNLQKKGNKGKRDIFNKTEREIEIDLKSRNYIGQKELRSARDVLKEKL